MMPWEEALAARGTRPRSEFMDSMMELKNAYSFRESERGRKERKVPRTERGAKHERCQRNEQE
jgi:hypothetical protein